MDNLSDSWTGQPTGGRIGAVEYVLRDLNDAITAGVARVGDRLPAEHALAARYGVSRTVIREVLRILETRGLTVTRTGRGTFVAALEATRGLRFGGYSASDLIEARPHIEVAAAGLAAVRRSEDQVTALQDLLEQMDNEQDPKKWVELDSSLHSTIAAASGNPVFADVLAQISHALVSQSSVINLAPGRREQSDSEHRAIVAAIARGSVAEAEDGMHFHLDQVKEVLLTITALDEQR
ncbi:FadR/GntR family transcriptional regulator [Microbacterium mangrovi]|uniref:FadR/GntR family transcriptional regulator n=1 Tax=Microbacterium mangrovi TaxID=1348253 RepID=UPI00068B493F|nr:FadR/GntR family transcriptional regulator [Microbacterium mangrovi]